MVAQVGSIEWSILQTVCNALFGSFLGHVLYVIFTKRRPALHVQGKGKTLMAQAGSVFAAFGQADVKGALAKLAMLVAIALLVIGTTAPNFAFNMVAENKYRELYVRASSAASLPSGTDETGILSPAALHQKPDTRNCPPQSPPSS